MKPVPRLVRHAVITYVMLLVALPIAALIHHAFGGGLATFVDDVTAPVAAAAIALTVGLAALAATVNAVGGLLIAWVLVRRDFPGRRFLSGLVDVPFAIPTLVTGVLLVGVYGPQTPLGAALIDLGMPVAYARPGILLAMLLVTLPLSVRTVEPIVESLDPDEEEAARTLGASRWLTFRKVLLPALAPALAAAWVQVFARAIAEFGSIAAVSGNVPRETMVASVYVLGELESGSSRSAAAVSVVLLLLALALQPIAQRASRRST